MGRFLSILALAALGTGAAAAAAADLPPTPWTEAGGRRTPRYAATVAWCEAAAAASGHVTVDTFGVSGRNRPLPLVVWDRRGRFAPGPDADRAVVLLQACIHAGESCGKDAGLELLRDLESGAFAARHGTDLDAVTLLFIPIFNVDGHERFSPWGRINQNGPEEMGWRTNARNLNLNRDYVKADTPEMGAWLDLWNRWDPDFLIDVHSTDGADYQYPVTYAVETHGVLAPAQTAWLRAWEQDVTARVAAAGFPAIRYVMFRDWHDPRSGLRTWAAGPRFSQGYAAVRNRPGLLIETHMLKDYPTRVRAAGAVIAHTLAWIDGRVGELRRLNREADARAASAAFRAEPFPLDWRLTDRSRDVEFRGYAYAGSTSAVTGGDFFVFSDRPETWLLPFQDELEPAATAALPEAYLVPPEWDDVIARLERHGVRLHRLAAPVELEVRTWRLAEPSWRERPYEGRHPVAFTPEPLTETRTWPAGTAVVDLAQAAAPIAAHLLEPTAPDALVGWGFFDPVFSRTEYAESYVIEAMIPDLLAAHPEWRVELEAAKAADPAFAADPQAIRDWFYRRTPYYDARVGIYPVGCVDSRGAVDGLPVE